MKPKLPVLLEERSFESIEAGVAQFAAEGFVVFDSWDGGTLLRNGSREAFVNRERSKTGEWLVRASVIDLGSDSTPKR